MSGHWQSGYRAKNILHNIKKYYATLFKNKNSELSKNINLSEIIENHHLNRLTQLQAQSLQGLVTLSILIVLKNMKNNKTP